MGRLLYALALIVIGASAAVIVTTSAALPPNVASHFGAGGAVNGYLSRDDYRLLMLGLATLMPVVVFIVVGVAPHVSPAMVNVPNLRAWLTPPYREDTLASLGARAAVFAIMLSAFICAVHLLVLRANAEAPPRLDAAALGMLLAVFLGATALWTIALLLRFRRPPR